MQPRQLEFFNKNFLFVVLISLVLLIIFSAAFFFISYKSKDINKSGEFCIHPKVATDNKSQNSKKGRIIDLQLKSESSGAIFDIKYSQRHISIDRATKNISKMPISLEL